MNLTRKEIAVGGVCLVTVVGTVTAIVMGTWELAEASLLVLQLTAVWLCLTILRRRPAAYGGVLNRIEQQMDELSQRVVTESQATAREVSALADQLRAGRAADETYERP